jgi:hypothetical protein
MGFLAAWARLIGRHRPAVPRRRGRKPRVPVSQLLPALTYHVMQDAGTVAEHFTSLFDETLADSSWADRRARLPWAIFTTLMQHALRPRATAARQPTAFWRGWRLIALDGTQFSLTNTPQITATTQKARTRRGRAAFAKMTTAVLLELGLHNPVAAAVGRQGESEWALAQRLLAQLPPRALLLGDRLYGVAAFLAPTLQACARVDSQCLIRASRVTKPRTVRRLADGTRLIQIGQHDRRQPAPLTLREIRVRVTRPGHRAHVLRLWTSLLDPTSAPARELAQLYAQRWEHELYFREVKRQLRRNAVLQSHTVETAAQEIAALVLASAVLATERRHAAGAAIPALRVSFSKLLLITHAMWLAVDLGDGLLSTQQLTQMIQRGRARLRRCLVAPRRARSCLRAVRQPMKAWPRLIDTQSVTGPFRLGIV